MKSHRYRAQRGLVVWALFAHCACAQCTLTATDLVFPSYNIFNNLDAVSTGYVNVTCDAGVRYTITLSAGSHSSTFSPRRLVKGGRDALGYNLFTSRNYQVVWDNGTNVYSGTGTGSQQSIPVHARIPARQTSVSAGLYTDTITATLTTD